MQRSLSISLSCFFGGLIGSLVSLEFATLLTTPGALALGMLVGGLVGYASVDFSHLRQGVTRAWHETINWRPKQGQLQAALAMFCGSLMLLLTVESALLFLFLLFSSEARDSMVSTLCIVGEFSLGGALPFFLITLMVNEEKKLQELRRKGWSLAWSGSPLGVIWLLFRGIFHATPLLLHFVFGEMLPAIVAFVKRSFLYVHSDVRVLCFVDAGLGSVTGFCFDNALVGGVAGALFGLLNYWLVSVKLLKLSVR